MFTPCFWNGRQNYNIMTINKSFNVWQNMQFDEKVTYQNYKHRNWKSRLNTGSACSLSAETQLYRITVPKRKSRDSSVDKLQSLGFGCTTGIRIPAMIEIFLFCYRVQTCSEVHPPPCPASSMALYPGVKRPEYGANRIFSSLKIMAFIMSYWHLLPLVQIFSTKLSLQACI